MIYRIDATRFSIEFLLLRHTAFDNLSVQLFAGLSVARKGNHLVRRKFEKSEAVSQERIANDWVLNHFFRFIILLLSRVLRASHGDIGFRRWYCFLLGNLNMVNRYLQLSFQTPIS